MKVQANQSLLESPDLSSFPRRKNKQKNKIKISKHYTTSQEQAGSLPPENASSALSETSPSALQHSQDPRWQARTEPRMLTSSGSLWQNRKAETICARLRSPRLHAGGWMSTRTCGNAYASFSTSARICRNATRSQRHQRFGKKKEKKEDKPERC